MKKSIERIFQRPAQPGMVGDGFRVFNMIPGNGISQKRMSPFLLLDFNAAFDFGPSDHIRGVDVHPHKGFETVTIAYKGSVAHHDSSGNSGVIRPGDVQWMTAGAGILHKEYHEEEFSKKGGLFEMVQLWVNLPAKDKSTAAHYQAITADQMGKVVLPDAAGVVNVIAGKFQDMVGPASTYTPVNLFDIKLEEQHETNFLVPQNHNTAMLVVNGEVVVNGELAKEHSFVLFGHDGEEISIRANKNAVLLVLSGEPIDEPIVSYGPFVMNTQAEIYQAFEDFQAGKFGVLE
ncbi:MULTISPECIES: pirin family protein [Sphingobacterium]|jgi:quercetin 2,3-dioxygenase|uniref:Putative Quercetin 2,3-dioxygenase n=1 Tax=Sphingobacterium multivorum TaxID=28454 RepID=A0A654DJC4_SPHMU|nr:MULTISPECIES: pirin family protein [Sphingobacterium]HAE65924.1 pirin family protein [Sphingobacterium sp.]MDF2851996.1 short-chain dehydrogenase [Sphingobacterium multivorum]OFV17170.1 short-chain dehydrogenase [Sphingobacterium sp. HMSC13C05]OJZ11337.1 MAG: short-chain dehydrogenase [Sphingobacterium sp. 40-24]QQT45702.1 pirin family protein [Sphingobacterium multivorum]